MIKRIARTIGLYFNPPKANDSFFADSYDFLCESTSERIFYDGMINRHGQNEWNFVADNNTYRFTITSASMPYYICNVEILVASVRDKRMRTWLKRSRPRRIRKKDFHRLIAEGRMIKTTSQSLFR